MTWLNLHFKHHLNQSQQRNTSLTHKIITIWCARPLTNGNFQVSTYKQNILKQNISSLNVQITITSITLTTYFFSTICEVFLNACGLVLFSKPPLFNSAPKCKWRGMSKIHQGKTINSTFDVNYFFSILLIFAVSLNF